MNILVINGHPDAGSFCESVFAEFVRGLNAKKHKIETLELGKMDFDPVLRFGYRKRMPEDAEILRSQELLKWADHLVFNGRFISLELLARQTIQTPFKGKNC